MFRKILGRRAEDAAIRFLKRNGLKIIETNFSCRSGEIDIIAKDNDEIVITEVRSASSCLFHDPLESITAQKIKRLQYLASAWLYSRKLADTNVRFDVVTVVFKENLKNVKIRHIKNAF